MIEQSGNALVGTGLGRVIIPVSFRVRWDIDRNYIVQKRRHSLRRDVSVTLRRGDIAVAEHLRYGSERCAATR